MPGDKASSRDSAVIDDDLVEALGFEPLSSTTSDEGDASTDGEEGSASDVAAAILGETEEDQATEVLADSNSESEESEASDSDEVSDNDSNEPETSDTQNLDHDESEEETLDLADFDDDPDGGSGFVLFGDDKAGDETSDEHTRSLFGERDDSESGLLLDEILAEEDETESTPGDLEADEGETAEELAEGDDLGGGDDLKVGPELDLVDDEIINLDDVEGSAASEFDNDPLDTESAFPDVPDLTGSELGVGDLAVGDLDDRTRPIEFDQDELESLEPEVLSLDPGLDPSDTPIETETTPAPVGVAPARTGYRRKRVRAKKTRRVIRHIDPWSVLTFSVLFHLALYAAFLLASVLVWQTLESSGMVENIEDFIIALGDYETYQINADVLFRAGVIIAGILTVASTILSVLLTVVFNLISDLVGGIRVTVLEEETVRLPSKKSAAK